MAEAVAAGCEVVEYSPNQVKQAVAGYGGAAKDQVERMVQTLLGIAQPLRPADAADAVAAGAVPPRRTRPMRAAGGPGGRPDDRLAAGHAARPRRPPRSLVEVAGVGYRVLGQPHDRRRARRRRRRGLPAGSTTTSARTPSPSTASPPATSASCFEALLGAHGVGPALALAILSVHAPDRPAPGRWPTTTSPRCASCPASARRRRARLLVELKSRLVDPRPRRRPRPPTVAGPTPRAGHAPAPTSARRSPGSATAADEVRDVMADLPDDGDAGALLRDALQRLAAARR